MRPPRPLGHEGSPAGDPMARQLSHPSSDNILLSEYSSTKGLQPTPNSNTDLPKRPTLWTVPRKRTSKGKKEKDFMYYDPLEELYFGSKILSLLG